jgi:hypothetical protein
LDFPHLPPPAEAVAAPVAAQPVAVAPPAPPAPPDAILAALQSAQANLVSNAAQLIDDAFAPPPGKWSKASLRRVGLSSLKAFATAAVAVSVARSSSLAGSHIDLTSIESTLLAIGIAGGGAALKVGEIFLEDK